MGGGMEKSGIKKLHPDAEQNPFVHIRFEGSGGRSTQLMLIILHAIVV